jgi:ribonuclease Z
MTSRTRRWLLAFVAVAALAAGSAYAWRGEIAVALMKRTIASNLKSDPIAALPDGLHVGLCGAGSPFADALRGGPCVAVVAGRRLFVVDAGDGSARTLQLMGLAPGAVEAVLLTHFHSDHIDGLGALMLQRWIEGSHKTPVPVHGPPGVEAIVAAFNTAYTPDRGYRIAHHGLVVAPPGGFGGMPKGFTIGAGRTDVVVLESEGLSITAFRVEHSPVEPAVGYVFTYKGRKLVISGDTAANVNVEAAAKGADLLVHEALAPNLVRLVGDSAKEAGRPNIAKVMYDIVDYHTTPEQAAAIAERAGVGYLLLHHIAPALPVGALEGPFLGKARNIYRGPIRVGRDGDLISMPAGSKSISHTNRLRWTR